MLTLIQQIFDDRAQGIRGRLAGIYTLLIVVNIGVWVWALYTFRHHPVMLGTALLAYSFGLRHAVDADHIAAIDNVTRKLMQEGKRPVSVGFFFAVGHSVWSSWRRSPLRRRRCAGRALRLAEDIGGIVGTLVSTLFLFAIAAMNIVICARRMENVPPRAARRPFRRCRILTFC